MTRIETIEKHKHEFDVNNVLQVARKVARDEDGNSTEFIALTRGYIDAQGSRRYKTNLTLPPDAELLAFLEDKIGRVCRIEDEKQEVEDS
jgi:hypothetical protein